MMKFTQSIRWRLQIWYGLILVAVLSGFGLSAYKLESGRQFHRIDSELQRRFSAILDASHSHGPPGHDHPPMDGPPDEFPPAGSPLDRPMDDPDGRGSSMGPHHFSLSPRAALLFETNQNAGMPNFFFILRGRDGQVTAQRGPVPEHLDITSVPRRPGETDEGRGGPPPMVNVGGSYRVLADTLPSGEMLIVGCSMVAEVGELHHAAAILILVGLGILVFGLAGGWWLVSRAMRPIHAIGEAAAKISSGDLTQRINAQETESELGQLAAVLNATFARLEAAFAQQRQFTADAAHELRTPVSVIVTQTQMALSRERSAADYKATVEACQRAAQRMRRLIESLLELARFDGGQETLKHIAFDLAPTIAESLQLIQPLAEQQNIQVKSEVESLTINGDPERIGQVLVNLLTNAIQYNRPGGEVRVRLGHEARQAVIAITDNGPGIGPEDLPRVTERFYRADQSRSTGGSGLGLSICTAILAAHNGSLAIASEPGKGTTVLVRLPMK